MLILASLCLHDGVPFALRRDQGSLSQRQRLLSGFQVKQGVRAESKDLTTISAVRLHCISFLHPSALGSNPTRMENVVKETIIENAEVAKEVKSAVSMYISLGVMAISCMPSLGVSWSFRNCKVLRWIRRVVTLRTDSAPSIFHCDLISEEGGTAQSRDLRRNRS